MGKQNCLYCRIVEEKIPAEFRNWVNEDAWFVRALKSNDISIWDFHLYTYEHLQKTYLSARADDVETISALLSMGYKVVDKYKGIVLLVKRLVDGKARRKSAKRKGRSVSN